MEDKLRQYLKNQFSIFFFNKNIYSNQKFVHVIYYLFILLKVLI